MTTFLLTYISAQCNFYLKIAAHLLVPEESLDNSGLQILVDKAIPVHNCLSVYVFAQLPVYFKFPVP